MFNRILFTSSVAVLASACATLTPTEKAATVVCPVESADSACDYVGAAGLQQAIDLTTAGGTIRMVAGEYTPTEYRDVPFEDLVVRGALVVDGKQFSLRADPGAILRGDKGFPLSAIVIRNSDVDISDLQITGFHYFEPEDDVYDGHGIFSIDSKVTLDRVHIDGISKMALTGRGDGRIVARNLVIQKSHLGVWLEESAMIDLESGRIVGSESAAIAAYGNAKAKIVGSIVDGNLDDGLYTEDSAEILSLRTRISNNSPYGARSANESKIVICEGALFGNKADVGEEGEGRVLVDAPEAC